MNQSNTSGHPILNYDKLGEPSNYSYTAPPLPYQRTAYDLSMQETFGLRKPQYFNPYTDPPAFIMPAVYDKPIPPVTNTLGVFVKNLQRNNAYTN
tara:strand:+ start:1347 stop:1631 length:285 start_codon:yes stop_codon:yes gene_type:complete